MNLMFYTDETIMFCYPVFSAYKINDRYVNNNNRTIYTKCIVFPIDDNCDYL